MRFTARLGCSLPPILLAAFFPSLSGTLDFTGIVAVILPFIVTPMLHRHSLLKCLSTWSYAQVSGGRSARPSPRFGQPKFSPPLHSCLPPRAPPFPDSPRSHSHQLLLTHPLTPAFAHASPSPLTFAPTPHPMRAADGRGGAERRLPQFSEPAPTGARVWCRRRRVARSVPLLSVH